MISSLIAPTSPNRKRHNTPTPWIKSLHLLLSYTFVILISLTSSIRPVEASYNQTNINNPETNFIRLDIISARKQYQEALAALRSGQRKRFHQLQAKLQNYPLFPYLIYYEYRRYIKTADKEDIISFINANQDSPLGYRLRRAWLRHLAATNQWQAYIDAYSPTSSAQYNCHYRWAQYQTDNELEALKGAKDLWLVGKSQHKNCNQLFEVWRKTDDYNDEVLWQRIALAINKGNTQLATYLSRSLNTAEDRRKVLDWKSIRSRPKKLNNINKFTTDDIKTREIILYGLYRLLRKDPALAISLWPTYQHKFQFTSDELNDFNLKVAKFMAYKYHPDADAWLQKVDLEFQDYDIHQRRIRLAIQQGRWADVYHWITLLPYDKAQNTQWQYWAAVSLEKIAGQLAVENYFIKDQQPLKPNPYSSPIDPLAVHNHFVAIIKNEPLNSLDFELVTSATHKTNSYLNKAKRIYESISTDRNYYSFLASERLQKPLSLNAMTPSFHDSELATIESKRGIQRARELYILGRLADARSEWYFTIQNFEASEKSTAAKLAELWGWHNQAILTASSSSHLDNLDLRFPRAYHDTIAYYARKLGLNSAWVFSVIRQESAFMPDARSPAGALGMMQLMPATAKQTTRKLGLRYKGEQSLLDPRRNIKVGTAYLSELVKKFNGNIVLATAAYNAGPHRVKRWRPTDQVIKGDIWIETIPFSETRNYVQNIMTYQAIYRYQLGQAPKLSQSLSYIYPKKKSVRRAVAVNTGKR